jgi:hypothetical protein
MNEHNYMQGASVGNGQANGMAIQNLLKTELKEERR